MIYGAIFYTIDSDRTKAARWAANVGSQLGEAVINTYHVWLVTHSMPDDRRGCIKFRIHPGVRASFMADMATDGAPRLDFVVWLGHAGPGYLSAADAYAVGPPQIDDMSLILPHVPASGAARGKAMFERRKIADRLARIGEDDAFRTVGKNTPHGKKIRTYISMAEVAGLLAIGNPLVIHMAACNFGQPGAAGGAGWPWKAGSGPRELGAAIATQVNDTVSYVAAMTYSTTDTGMPLTFVPGDAGFDQGQVIIENGAATQSSPSGARARVERQRRAIATAEAMRAIASSNVPSDIISLISSFE